MQTTKFTDQFDKSSTNKYTKNEDKINAIDPSIDFGRAGHFVLPYMWPIIAANVSPIPIAIIPADERACVRLCPISSFDVMSSDDEVVSQCGRAQASSRYMCERISGPRSHDLKNAAVVSSGYGVAWGDDSTTEVASG